MSVSDLTKDIREKLNLKGQGVVVNSVEKGVAFKAGVRPGDVILQLGGHDVKNVKHIKKLVKKMSNGKFVSVLINRQGNPIFLALKLG